MLCRKCGKTIDEKMNFCPYCQTKIEKQIVYMKKDNINQSAYNSSINFNQFNNQKQKRNYNLLIVIVSIALFFIILSFGGNGVLKLSDFGDLIDNIDKPNIEKPSYDNDLAVSSGTRTFMIYIIGSDLESRGGAATKDINEMIKSNYNTEDVNVLLYVGGTKKWQNNTFSENENAIYELNGKEIKKVKTYSKKSMSSPDTLTEFIDYVYENYQTDLYSLILWDHGGGPLIGYGADENYKTMIMSIIDIDKAINDSKLIRNTKFEFIGFDACLMGSLEIANALKEEANYLVASAESIPGDGWDYSFLKDVNKYTNTEDIGKSIIDKYYFQYKHYTLFGTTLSLMDLRNIDSLVLSIDELFEETDSKITNSSYTKISRDVSKAVMYGYDATAKTQLDLIDLYGLTEEIEQSTVKANKVKQEIENTIVYHKTTIEDCHGISMYFPVTTQKSYDKYMTKNNYNELIVSKNYKNFLNKYTNIANGNRLVKSTIDEVVPELTSSEIYATIPTDIAQNYQTAHYLVFRKMDDGSYLPIYKSKDVSIDGNKISATVANRRLSVSDSNGKNEEDVIAYEISRDDNYITYVLTSVLQYWDDNDYFKTFEIEAVNIYFKVDRNTNEGIISDIKPVVTEGELVPKITYDLNDWLYMQFLSSSYFLYDEDGNKLEDWKPSGVMYGTEVNIKDGYKISVSELSKEHEYYYMFSIKDTQGNLYETNLVKAFKTN